jgi:hypothetical protein
MPCDPWGNNPGGPIGFDDLLMNRLWLEDPPCSSAAGDFWDVFNRTEGKQSSKLVMNDSISKGDKVKKIH